MSSRLDPFASHSVDELKALGPRAVVELISIIETRAEARDETFVVACRHLPQAWQATMLLAHVTAAFEQGDSMAEVLWDLESDAARLLVIAALKEIGEKSLSASLGNVHKDLDYGAEDLDESNADVMLPPPPPDDLARIRKKLIALVRGMDTGFPEA
jgi:hypothetical protein